MKKSMLLIPLVWLFIVTLYGWQSSNDESLYTMDELCSLSDSISFNSETLQYEVRCDIIIMENDTLKIHPGEVVKFVSYPNPNGAGYVWQGLFIYGNLLSLGTQEENIKLYNDSEYNVGSWKGIKFYNTSPNNESIIRYTIIEEACDKFNYTAIYCYNSSPNISYCTVREMYPPIETGGGSGIYCAGQSYPIVSYCTFEELRRSVAVWCGNSWNSGYGGHQDTLNYPSPLMIGCNIMPSVHSFWGYGCDNDKVVLNGGFLDNCYLGIDENDADITLGYPPDTTGDGICNTTSINWIPKYMLVDGIVNPRETPDLVGIDNEEINILPTGSKYILLNKNYPNPFNPSTTIDFEIKKDNVPISLKIYNSRGQLVKTLINEEIYHKGNHSIVWNGDNKENEQVSSGVYFFKLISNKHMQIKKAILVK